MAESVNALLEKFFEEGGLSEETMRAGIHPAVQQQVFVPLLCTAGETNVGVARLRISSPSMAHPPTTVRRAVPCRTRVASFVSCALIAPSPRLTFSKRSLNRRAAISRSFASTPARSGLEWTSTAAFKVSAPRCRRPSSTTTAPRFVHSPAVAACTAKKSATKRRCSPRRRRKSPPTTKSRELRQTWHAPGVSDQSSL